MTRRAYIYMALPLFVILSCGPLLCAQLGELGALILASVFMLVAWGVVWLRFYRLKYRPELAVLSILPQGIYFISRYVGTQLFAQSPALQNLYALTWLGFAGVSIASMRSDDRRPAAKDPVFLLMIPLILLYCVTTFTPYYTTLISL